MTALPSLDVTHQADAPPCASYTAWQWSPSLPRPENDECVNCGRSSLAHPAPKPCTAGWAGCDGNYTGGHFCERDDGHTGRHRCECGATAVVDHA